jgi:toxin-antitoxin system PIN domain toxin
MAVALLDVNVMLALAWRPDVRYDAARRWFHENRSSGWATCALTELGFLRLSIQPAIVKTTATFADAVELLRDAAGTPEHQFWPLDYSVAEIRPEIRSRLIGHQQLADALLLDLAIRKGGRLATFDRRIQALLPPDSVHHDAIELIPA